MQLKHRNQWQPPTNAKPLQHKIKRSNSKSDANTTNNQRSNRKGPLEYIFAVKQYTWEGDHFMCSNGKIVSKRLLNGSLNPQFACLSSSWVSYMYIFHDSPALKNKY